MASIAMLLLIAAILLYNTSITSEHQNDGYYTSSDFQKYYRNGDQWYIFADWKTWATVDEPDPDKLTFIRKDWSPTLGVSNIHDVLWKTPKEHWTKELERRNDFYIYEQRYR